MDDREALTLSAFLATERVMAPVTLNILKKYQKNFWILKKKRWIIKMRTQSAFMRLSSASGCQDGVCLNCETEISG